MGLIHLVAELIKSLRVGPTGQIGLGTMVKRWDAEADRMMAGQRRADEPSRPRSVVSVGTVKPTALRTGL